MAWKLPPPPPPDSTDFCTCYQPVSVSGTYCATCGKKLRSGGSLPPPPGPPGTTQTPHPAAVHPVMKPVMVAPAVASPPATMAQSVHPLEQRFMAHMLGQPIPAAAPVMKPVPKPVSQAPLSMPPLSLTSPLAVSKPPAPPSGITPPSAFPTFTPSAPKPMKSAFPPPSVAAPKMDMPGLTFANPLAQPSTTPPKPFPSLPSGSPSTTPRGISQFELPTTPSAQVTAPTNEQAADMQLGFDIGDAEKQIAPEQKKAFEFESIMERFKNVITTEQKLLAYDFADKIGVVDFIEQFYEFLAHPDKDGIIVYKGEEVKINKTKIMGALMLGDNTMLDRALTSFRAWLMKIIG